MHLRLDQHLIAHPEDPGEAERSVDLVEPFEELRAPRDL